jgi:hypothetical protein
MNSTIAPPKPAKAAAVTVPARLAGASRQATVVEFDSTAIDIITARVAEIQALASCSICLSAVLADPNGTFSGYELADDALPLLADVIRRLAGEVGEAGDVLWEQYTEALNVADGEVQS